VAALVVGVAAAADAAAALGGAAAGLAGGVAAFVGAGEEDNFVSTLLPIAGVAATEGAVFAAVGGMAGVGGAALGNRAVLGCGAFLSVTTAGAFSGPAQPETNSANNVAVRAGTRVENIFVQDIFSPIGIKQMSSGHYRCVLASENSGVRNERGPVATYLPSPHFRRVPKPDRCA